MKPAPIPTYRIETGISVTGFGVLWPVCQFHGRCGCGEVEMSRVVGYFTSRNDAEAFVSMVTHFEKMAGNTDGTRRV